MSSWTASSWRSKPITQNPIYPDQAALEQAEKTISRFPP